MVGFPEMNCTLTRGLALGVGAMLPQVGLGLGLWHRTKRSGIVMPIALLVFRFLGSSLLFAIFLWQFPTEQKIIAWSGSTLIIVFTSLEAIFFARGVDRL